MDDRPYLRILRDQITIDTLRATFGEGWYVFRTDEVWCARAVPSGTPRTPGAGCAREAGAGAFASSSPRRVECGCPQTVPP
jgi:hypothetical protein